MSKTDKTKPWKLLSEAERMTRRKFWTDNSDVRFLSRLYNRKDRHDARAELRKGEEPEPRQSRGRAIWDVW